MRPSRRAVLGLSVGTAAVAAAVAWRSRTRHGSDGRRPVAVRSTPIASLEKAGSGRRSFGDLLFRSGLVLSSDDDGFGGVSGLCRDPRGGAGLVAVTDHGQWLTAQVETESGRLAGLVRAEMAPILDETGVPLRHGRAYDTEALAIDGGVAYVGIERVHEVRRFDWAQGGVASRGVMLPLPPETRDLPANGSIEAVAAAPPGHRLAGALVAIAEEARRGADAPTRGWVVTGPDRFGFDVARSDAFDVTDAAFLPDGDLLLLERRYALGRGVACRLRRIPGDAIRPDALLDGRVMFEADDGYEIDNMEGLAIHRDGRDTVVTLLSDDNFNPLQRTLMLEFSLVA